MTTARMRGDDHRSTGSRLAVLARAFGPHGHHGSLDFSAAARASAPDGTTSPWARSPHRFSRYGIVRLADGPRGTACRLESRAEAGRRTAAD